jgi:hypothetical protein
MGHIVGAVDEHDISLAACTEHAIDLDGDRIPRSAAQQSLAVQGGQIEPQWTMDVPSAPLLDLRVHREESRRPSLRTGQVHVDTICDGITPFERVE